MKIVLLAFVLLAAAPATAEFAPFAVPAGSHLQDPTFAPDGKTFYVYNTLDFEVAVYDADSLKLRQKIRVCENPLGDEILRGKVLFYSEGTESERARQRARIIARRA